jgi:hypothetical protein
VAERLFVAALATWRITSLLLREDGPFDIFVTWRSAVGRVRGLEPLTTCAWCLSLWVGTAVAIVMLSEAWLMLIPFALSTVAIVGERCLGQR